MKLPSDLDSSEAQLVPFDALVAPQDSPASFVLTFLLPRILFFAMPFLIIVSAWHRNEQQPEPARPVSSIANNNYAGQSRRNAVSW